MNKRLFLKWVWHVISLSLVSQPVLEENIRFSSCKEAWANGYEIFTRETLDLFCQVRSRS